MLPNINTSGLVQSSFDFLPELVLCFAVVLLLVLRLFRMFDRMHMGSIAFTLTAMALLCSAIQWANSLPTDDSTMGGIMESARDFFPLTPPSTARPQMLYGADATGATGLLFYDHLTVYLRLFLYSFALLVIWLSLTTGIPDREDSSDFYVLLLGATLGMALMASSAHLLMVFMAVEMASLPSYALAGFLKGRRQSSEAALKYVVYGGGASGVMLYGISLLAGKFGTAYLPEVAQGFAASFQSGAVDPVLVLGALFVLIGIAFKLSAVPFHFWCPDVFEGASAEVAGFLSVASKGAALAMLARFTLLLTGLDPITGTDPLPWKSVLHFLLPTLAFFAAVTATFGNLAAYQQTNLKRLLAYSTIAHAGYMIMGLCTMTRAGLEAVLFYMVAYLFMNLGAFAVVAYLRNSTHSEDLNDFRGLIRRSPVMVVTLSLFLLSLLGIPPLVGFPAKFQVFMALYKDGQAYSNAGEPGLGTLLIGLLVIGGLNTVISAFYYIRVMRVMILERRAEDLEGTEPPPLGEPASAVSFVSVFAAVTLVLGLFWGPLSDASRLSVERFRTEPGRDALAKGLNQDAFEKKAAGELRGKGKRGKADSE